MRVHSAAGFFVVHSLYVDVMTSPWQAEFPYSPRLLRCEAGEYAYVDEGAGEPIVCVHGNPTWSFAFRRVIREFSPTRRVLAVDHIGCGRSSKPQDYAYRLAQHIDNFAHFITALDLSRITLVVHDWGGAIGLGAAGRMPERFARLVILNTAAFRSQRIPWRIAVCRWPWLGTLGVRGFNLFARAALSMAVARPEVMTPAVCAGYLAPYDSWANRIATHRFVQDIPLAASHPSYATLLEVEQNLGRLTHLPTQLIWGERDWCFTPWFRKEFERRFPNARSTPLPHAGHYLFEDAPEDLLRVMRAFLDETA